MDLKTFPRHRKKMLRMKFLIPLWILALVAVSSSGYSQTITLSFKNASLENVLTAIERQTDCHFIFTSEELGKAAPVSINVKSSPLADVLKICFANQPLDFFVDGHYITVKKK
jgi:hypothetical protein